MSETIGELLDGIEDAVQRIRARIDLDEEPVTSLDDEVPPTPPVGPAPGPGTGGGGSTGGGGTGEGGGGGG